MGIELVERDYRIMRDIERFRFCLSRHIRILAGFEGQRVCDKRLKELKEAGYIEKKMILYGVPGVYYVTYKGKMLIGANKRQDKIRVEKIVHDIAVLDTVIYFLLKRGIDREKIETEKELNSKSGFSTRKHQPDFTYEQGGKKHCVEIEMTAKGKQRFEQIVEENYLNYETQHWVITKSGVKIRGMLEGLTPKYQNIEIIEIEGVQEIARGSK